MIATGPAATLGLVSSVELTPRERAVLAAIERRLTNPEIAGEQFVSIRTVESHIASLRRKLAAETRAELMAAAGRLRSASVRVPHNPLRGRAGELLALADLLEAGRWATVTGPGGVGKTRLALEFAARSTATPLVVELEHAGPDDVVARISRVLDLESAPDGDPLLALATALAAHPFLLVLDNIDRVGPSVRDTVARLLARAPSLHVLTTSRTPVGDDGEAVVVLGPLEADGPDSAAVALLADRIAAHRSPLTPAERADAAHIAARLDGVPLALELAASVARHLPLHELSARLDASLTPLDRAAPAGKHRTLETAFDWTWDLLADDEQDVLRRVAALPRTFDIDLAVAVTHPGAEGTIVRLLDHSMLVALGGSPQRFRLLAVVREFVHARTDATLIGDVQRLHAEYFDALVIPFAAIARRDDSPAAMHMSELLCPEVNAALRWAVAAHHPAALRLATSLSVGVEQYGSDIDSVNSLAIAARDAGVRETASPDQLLAIGLALTNLDVTLVAELAGVALARADDDASLLAGHHLAGIAAAYGSAPAEALVHFDEAERLALALGDVWQSASVSQMRGIALRSASPDVGPALASLEISMRRYAHAGDRHHIHNSQYMMALMAAEAGVRREEAAGWAAACADYAIETGNRHELAHAHLAQAMLGAFDDDVSELADEFRRFGDMRCLFRSLVLRARGAAPLEARALLEEAEAVATLAGDRARQVDALRQLARANWDLGDRAATLGTLDRLSMTADLAAARAACPDDLRAEFEQLTV